MAKVAKVQNGNLRENEKKSVISISTIKLFYSDNTQQLHAFKRISIIIVQH